MGGGPPAVHLPRSGPYSGHTEDGGEITVSISGKTVEYVAFAFKCDGAVGHTNLQDFELTRSRRGYRFSLDAHSGVAYSDDLYYPGENAAVAVAGRFTRSGKRVSGRLHVEAPRCETGSVDWRARRR